MVTWSIYCHSKTNLSQKQIPDDYFEYNLAYVRKRQAYSVRTIKSTKWMHTEWHKWLLLVIGLSWQSEADPGEGPGGPAPPYPTLFLDQTEAWRAKKIFLGDWAPPLSKGLDDPDVHFPILFTWGCRPEELNTRNWKIYSSSNWNSTNHKKLGKLFPSFLSEDNASVFHWGRNSVQHGHRCKPRKKTKR